MFPFSSFSLCILDILTEKFPHSVPGWRLRITHTWKYFRLLCEFLQYQGAPGFCLYSLYVLIFSLYILKKNAMTSNIRLKKLCSVHLERSLYSHFQGKQNLIHCYLYLSFCLNVHLLGSWGEG